MVLKLEYVSEFPKQLVKILVAASAPDFLIQEVLSGA